MSSKCKINKNFIVGNNKVINIFIWVVYRYGYFIQIPLGVLNLGTVLIL